MNEALFVTWVKDIDKFIRMKRDTISEDKSNKPHNKRCFVENDSCS